MQCPLLCKEFIIDAWQIYYARTKGADAILLIAAVLPDLDIKYMTKICKMLGLATLVEVSFYVFGHFCVECLVSSKELIVVLIILLTLCSCRCMMKEKWTVFLG